MVLSSSRAGKWILPLIAGGAAVLLWLAWSGYPVLTGSLSGPGSESKPQTRNQVYFGPANSIAVLPFENAAFAQDQAFWSTGFAGELHRLMTRMPGIHVTSRNSSFFFQDQTIPPQLIAERLQCTYLLSGDFKPGDAEVQVTARLYDAREEQEVWSQVYSREPGEIFEIQGEILDAVMTVLKVEQAGSSARTEPVDSRALEWYLEGQFYRERQTQEGFQRAEEAYWSALEINPDYALPRIALAGVWLEQSAAVDGERTRVEDARKLLEQVLYSMPDSPGALGLLSHIRHQYDWDWRGALEAAERARELNPGDPELMSAESLALATLGQFDTAGELLEASVRQDPLNLSRRLRLGLLQEFSGDYDKALSSYRQVIGLNPELPAARAFRARVKIIQDKPDSAMRESELEVAPFWKRYSKILALIAQNHLEEAQPLLQQMIAEDGQHAAYQITEILAFQGNVDTAFEWFQKAYDQKDGGMSGIIGNHFLNNLHDDPRWAEMLALMGLQLDLKG